MDQYTEVTTESWGSRLMGSIKGVLLGIIMIIVAIGLLWWNEGRAVRTAKGLKEGAAALVPVSADEVNPKNEGKLVYLTGKANTDEVLEDTEFGVSVNALRLKREVEMFQWVEKTEERKEKKLGGSEETITTYNYVKEWTDYPVNSNEFKIQEEHVNPPGFPIESYEKTAQNVNIEAYQLNENLVSSISGFKVYNDFSKLPENAEKQGDIVFVGKGEYSSPQIGDVRISFSYVPVKDVSLIAKQSGNSFSPYRTSTGSSIALIESGIVSADDMFASAHAENNMWTWILRIVGFLLMTGGFAAILKPLSVVADVVPFIGNMLEMGAGIISGVISFALSFIIIAAAWIFYRPVLGVSLLLIGTGVFVFFFMKGKKRKQMKQEEELATA